MIFEGTVFKRQPTKYHINIKMKFRVSLMTFCCFIVTGQIQTCEAGLNDTASTAIFKQEMSNNTTTNTTSSVQTNIGSVTSKTGNQNNSSKWNSIRGKQCPKLEPPKQGYVTYSVIKHVTIATYTCDVGLSVTSGDVIRLCDANSVAEWTGNAPTCQFDSKELFDAISNLIRNILASQMENCPQLSPPENGDVKHDSTTPGSVAVYRCMTGYSVTMGEEERTCGWMGEWSGVEPVCGRDTGEPDWLQALKSYAAKVIGTRERKTKDNGNRWRKMFGKLFGQSSLDSNYDSMKDDLMEDLNRMLKEWIRPDSGGWWKSLKRIYEKVSEKSWQEKLYEKIKDIIRSVVED